MSRRLPAELELTDGVVTLRRWTHADVPALTAIWQDPELRRRFGVEPPVTDRSTAAWVDGLGARWRDGLHVALAIVADGRVGGGCELDGLDADRPDLGYWLAPDARGLGYATRAAALLVEWAGAELGVTDVGIEVEPDNAASIAVAQRLGFTLVPGVERADDDRRLIVYERGLGR